MASILHNRRDKPGFRFVIVFFEKPDLVYQNYDNRIEKPGLSNRNNQVYRRFDKPGFSICHEFILKKLTWFIKTNMTI